MTSRLVFQDIFLMILSPLPPPHNHIGNADENTKEEKPDTSGSKTSENIDSGLKNSFFVWI